jgi:glycosyltransferase involved in cell wall biosynthesis
MRIGLSVDQLYRPQPGGIGTYVRGLVRGLEEIGVSDITGLAPSGPLPNDVSSLGIPIASGPLPVQLLSRLWTVYPIGVGRSFDVVHATAMSGPFDKRAHRRSVTVHDLLWRDEPGSTTRSGASFHERRLRRIVADEGIHIVVTSLHLRDRLIAEGVSPHRLFVAPLGADEDDSTPEEKEACTKLLSRFEIAEDFTLSAGTLEPRKNVERLVAAHKSASSEESELGPLVIVGPHGWSHVDTGDAVVLGAVTRGVLNELYRRARVVAYVPRAEGWGLPPVEALHAGTAVVVSTQVPSVAGNTEIESAAFDDIDGLASALVRAARRGNGEMERKLRRDSVAHLTWRNCAELHLKAWL